MATALEYERINYINDLMHNLNSINSDTSDVSPEAIELNESVGGQGPQTSRNLITEVQVQTEATTILDLFSRAKYSGKT